MAAIGTFSNGASGSAIRTKLNTLILKHDDVLDGLIAPVTFTALTPVNSWVNFEGGYMGLGYYSDVINQVRVVGLIKNGTTTSGILITTLPVGKRPPEAFRFLTETSPAGSACAIAVSSTGTINAFGTIGSAFLSLVSPVFSGV